MSLTRSGNIGKQRAPSNVKQQTYWRGGDSLKEKEYLMDEYRHALTDYRKAEFDLKQVENEYKEAQETLREREEYTSALANYLDSDAQGGQQESEYKKRLAELEQEIKQAELELQQVKAVHHPAVASGLQKEKAYLLIENQRTAKAIDLACEQGSMTNKQLAACMASNKYRNAKELEGKQQELTRKRAYLRGFVNRVKKEFDGMRPVGGPQTDEARVQRAALVPKVEIDEILRREEEKKQRRPKKWENRLARMIDDIEDLNDRMIDLGMEDQIVDVDALRQKYFPSEEKQENVEEEERNE